MTTLQKLTKFIEDNPKARERKNKDLALAHIIKGQFGWDMPTDKLAEALHKYNTLDRAWRGILQDRVDLRGSDYGDKDRLEQEKLLELGY